MTHMRGGRTHNVTQRTDTHIFTGRGGGRTFNVTQPTDPQILLDTQKKRTDKRNGQSHILRQHAA